MDQGITLTLPTVDFWVSAVTPCASNLLVPLTLGAFLIFAALTLGAGV